MTRLLLFIIAVFPAWPQTAEAPPRRVTRPARLAAGLAQRVNAALGSSEATRRAYWGWRVVRLDTGATVLERNAGQTFVPASNTKLFTTAMALERLGPDHRFITRVTGAPPDGEGVVRGDLVLAGGGDPTISGRVLPYAHAAEPGDPLAPLRELAAQVWQAGVRRIQGDVVGDDTRWPWEPFPEGWGLHDAVWEYGAPVSALTFNENSQRLTLFRDDDPPALRLRLEPPIEYFTIHNLAVGGEQNRLHVERPPGSREMLIVGTLERATASQTCAVDDPALYAALAFRHVLMERGIVVAGSALSRHRHAGQTAPAATGVELARRVSPPLVETLRVINKVSHNLQAEMVLRETALVRRGKAGREDAIEELKDFLKECSIEPGDFHFADGSGLSRLTLVTPRAIVRLLERMHRSRHAALWRSLLPVGGEDGTLSLRFRDLAPEQRPIAKTGTLSHVSALAGYVRTRTGKPLAFSVIVNNGNGPASDLRAAMDKIVEALLEQ